MTVVFKKIGVPSFFSNFMFEFANHCTFHVCLLPEHMSIFMSHLHSSCTNVSFHKNISLLVSRPQKVSTPC